MFIIKLFSVYLFFFAFGLSLLSILRWSNHRIPGLNSIVGFGSANLIFYGLFLITHSGTTAFTTLLLIVILTSIYAASTKLKQMPSHSFFKHLSFELAVLLVVGLCVGFNILFNSDSTYWSTGTRDAIDGLVGGRYYFDGQAAIDKIYPPLAQNLLSVMKGSFYFAHRFAVDYQEDFWWSTTALQYSSIGFLSELINEKTNFTSIFIQGLLSFFWMFTGIFYWARSAQKCSLSEAIAVAGLSVFNHFYITTFNNIHIGSMLFGAVIPFLLIGLEKQLAAGHMKKMDRQCVFGIFFSLVFLALSYWQPIVFYLAPFLFLLCRPYISLARLRELKKSSLFLATFACAILGGFAIWKIFGARSNGITQYKSWGAALKPDAILMYFGLERTSGQFLNWYLPSLRNLSLFLIAITLITLLSTTLAFLAKSRSTQFVKYFLFLNVGFGVILFTTGNSYYFYKFLYTTQFVVIFILFDGLKNVLGAFAKRKILFSLSIMAISSLNLAQNYLTQRELQSLAFNNPSANFESLLTIPTEVLRNSFIDSTSVNQQIINLLLSSIGILPIGDIKQAKYVITTKGFEDIYFRSIYRRNDLKIVFENNRFVAFERPTNYLTLKSFWEPEANGEVTLHQYPFRWISGRIESTSFIQGHSNLKFLRFCANPGPGIHFESKQIVIRDLLNPDTPPHTVQAIGLSCFFVPLKRPDFLIGIEFTKEGQIVPGFDDRQLNYQMFGLGFVDNINDESTLAIYNPKIEDEHGREEILTSKPFYFGKGWFPEEQAPFRQGSDDVEVLSYCANRDGCSVNLDLEPGPSAIPTSTRLKVFIRGRVVQEFALGERMKISLKVPKSDNHMPVSISLKINGDRSFSKTDSRDLRLRLYDF